MKKRISRKQLIADIDYELYHELILNGGIECEFKRGYVDCLKRHYYLLTNKEWDYEGDEKYVRCKNS